MHFYFSVQLVEANPNPGVQLVNVHRTNKAGSSDLIDLAREIQNVII